MANLDPRLLRVSVEVNGQLRTYDNLAIVVQGQKFANANQGEANVSIINLDREVSDQILTEASPFNRNRTPKRVIVEAGRQSTGYSTVYSGNIYRATSTQPPDQILTIRGLTGNFQAGNIVAKSQPPSTPLSDIVTEVGQDIGMAVDFQASNRRIANYTHNGAAIKQVDKLNDMGVEAFVDNDTLVVKDRNTAKRGSRHIVRPEDIVGKPEITEQGVRVTILFDNRVQLGGELDLTSRQYPAVSGRYNIYKLSYHLANRDTPWYLTMEASFA